MNLRERTSRLSLEFVFHSVINTMLMLKKDSVIWRICNEKEKVEVEGKIMFVALDNSMRIKRTFKR